MYGKHWPNMHECSENVSKNRHPDYCGQLGRVSYSPQSRLCKPGHVCVIGYACLSCTF